VFLCVYIYTLLITWLLHVISCLFGEFYFILFYFILILMIDRLKNLDCKRVDFDVEIW
jgi:phage shock protein PspC (stress-responsive transcriptional regulator)